MILIGVFISLQVFITFRGIKYLKNGEWARPSYEEKSARTLNKWLHDNNHILLVSLPEPYYLYTNSSTQSTTADLPFLDPDSTLDNSKIYIVEDMGTYDYFPKFAEFLDKNMQNKLVYSYWVNEIYHTKDISVTENHPVRIYYTTLAQLKKNINTANIR